jgi:hypothetical protein
VPADDLALYQALRRARAAEVGVLVTVRAAPAGSRRRPRAWPEARDDAGALRHCERIL